MPLFEYKALNQEGKKIKGIITADGPSGARMSLSSEMIYPMEIREVTPADAQSRGDSILSRIRDLQRINPVLISTSLRQLAALVSSKLPLVDCLNALIEQTENVPLKKIFTHVREKVIEGSPLSVAMADHPSVFSKIDVNMVKAGETGGALDLILIRLADFAESRVKFKKKVDNAMAYPMVLIMTTSIILIILMSVVMPKVIGIFKSMKVALPIFTRILISITGFISNFWWLIIIVCILMIAGFIYWKKTEKGGYTWDQLKLRFPLFSKIHKKIAIARFTRTLSILLKSGIPLVESLNISGPAMGNRIMEDGVQHITRLVGEGEDFSGPVKKSGLFPTMVVQLIQAGEQSGELEDMLEKAAELYEDDVDATVSTLTAMVEPAIILIMGFMVGFIVLSILMPIFDMTSGLR